MAITRQQIISIGFKPTKMAKSLSGRKFDTLVYPLNKTDYIYIGYNKFTKEIDFKRIWKCFQDPDTLETISYPVDKIGALTYESLKEYVEQSVRTAKLKKEIYG